jgi:hypothetical protein
MDKEREREIEREREREGQTHNYMVWGNSFAKYFCRQAQNLI